MEIMVVAFGLGNPAMRYVELFVDLVLDCLAIMTPVVGADL